MALMIYIYRSIIPGSIFGSLFFLTIVAASPAFAEEPAAADSETATDSQPDPTADFEYYTETRGEGPSGSFTILGVVARGSVSSGREQSIVRELVARIKSDQGRARDGLTVVLYSPYSSQLLAQNGEDIRWAPNPYEFRRFLHQECYDKIDYEVDDAHAKRRADVDCYMRYSAQYLSGATMAFNAYSVWGVRIENIPYWNPIAMFLLAFSLIVFTLPPMASYLLFVWLFRDFVRDDLLGQRLLKVLSPIAIGIAWFMFWMSLIATFGHFPGILNSMKAWLWLSGIFFALNFIACMWLADHCFFPENQPPRLWVVALFYLFGPLLIAAGGAAGGAAAGGLGTAGGSGSGKGRSDTSGGPGKMSGGGGGSFGGGGASGTF